MDADGLRNSIESLDYVARRAEELARGLTQDQVTWKPSPDRFSIRETIWHLRDIDAEGFLPRLQRVLNEDRPFLADVDGARLARERGYNELDASVATADLKRGRRTAGEVLRSLTESQLDRPAELEEVGSITLGELIERWLQHDSEHLIDLEQLRQQLETVSR
jgi:DinB superfamily